MSEPLRVSIVIPALNEEKQIQETLHAVFREKPFEVIVVDGNSTDGTVDAVREFPDVTLLISGKRGRSFQMNEGAKHCSGHILLFLHADSLLPDGWLTYLTDRMQNREFIGGCYFVELSNSAFLYRLTGWMINVRTLLFRSFTGDQGIFLRRDVFEKMGGFAPVPLMEDLIMADRLRKAGRVSFIRKPIVTSARKWEKHGPFRTIFLMWNLKILFRLGRLPEQLAPYYREGKFPPLFF